MQERPAKAVVFDLGGVLLDWDPRHLYRKLIADPGERETFLSEVCTPAWHAEHDLGRSISESCRELALRHPEHAALIGAWDERNEEMVEGEIVGTVALHRELRRRAVPCYVLSNMEREAFGRRLRRFGFLQDFDGYVVSGEEGLAKPDDAIFALAIARFAIDPTETLFVDDAPANLAAARRRGFRVAHFVSPEGLAVDLAANGLAAAPGESRG